MTRDMTNSQTEAEDGLAPPASSDISQTKETALDKQQSEASIRGQQSSYAEQPEQLKRHLKGRHVQMIAIGT
jgi:amino acid permease